MYYPDEDYLTKTLTPVAVLVLCAYIAIFNVSFFISECYNTLARQEVQHTGLRWGEWNGWLQEQNPKAQGNESD